MGSGGETDLVGDYYFYCFFSELSSVCGLCYYCGYSLAGLFSSIFCLLIFLTDGFLLTTTCYSSESAPSSSKLGMAVRPSRSGVGLDSVVVPYATSRFGLLLQSLGFVTLRFSSSA